MDRVLDVIYITYILIVFIFGVIQSAINPDDDDVNEMRHSIFLAGIGLIIVITLIFSIANIIWNSKILRIISFYLNYIIIPGSSLVYTIIDSLDYKFIGKYTLVTYILAATFFISLLSFFIRKVLTLRRIINDKNGLKEKFLIRTMILVSITLFLAVSFVIIVDSTFHFTLNLLLITLSGSVGNIIIGRLFLTNARINKTSCIDYYLSDENRNEEEIEIPTALST